MKRKRLNRDGELAPPPTVFMAHSKEDSEGREFFDRLFSGAGVRAYWYPYPEGPTIPHSKGIRRAIKESSAVFVVLSKPMEVHPHIRSWVSFESGIAVGLDRPIWVFERFDEFVDIPVPGAFGYLQRPLTTTQLQTFPFGRIISSAGTRYPPAEGSDVWFHAICRHSDCGERFVAYVLDASIARCPTCRREGTIKIHTWDERAMALLDQPLLKPLPNQPVEDPSSPLIAVNP
jgi:hypothetical protein